MRLDLIFQGRQRAQEEAGRAVSDGSCKKEWSGRDVEKQKSFSSIHESLQLCGCNVKQGKLES